MRTAHLIVPIRDRRKHRRILTLKNFRRVAIAMVIFFLGVTIQSDLRHSTSTDYGRLFGKQVSSQVAVAPKVEPVREAPIADQTAADPLLLSAAAREQYLRVETTTTAPPQSTTAVSGPNGIVIVRGKIDQSHPTLSGGIFRQ